MNEIILSITGVLCICVHLKITHYKLITKYYIKSLVHLTLNTTAGNIQMLPGKEKRIAAPGLFVNIIFSAHNIAVMGFNLKDKERLPADYLETR